MTFFRQVMTVSAIAAVACVPSAVQARPMWGVLGHYMTAAIAQGFLSNNATNAIANLIPETNGDMSLVASWADQVGRNAYRWSPPLHYINTPDWACTYDRTRDCIDSTYGNNYCVDAAIQNFTSQIVSNNAPLSLNVALKFVIHFIGDIHQPLHVGFTSDEGGNTITGTFEGTPSRRLHQVWDEDMLEKRINDDYQGDNSTYLQYFMNRLQSGDWKSQISSWQSCPSTEHSNIQACSISWAQQSTKLACTTAYVDSNGNKIQTGFDLEDPYYEFALPVAELQLARGGIRMANVMNHMFASPSMAKYVVPREEFLAAEAEEESMRNAPIAEY